MAKWIHQQDLQSEKSTAHNRGTVRNSCNPDARVVPDIWIGSLGQAMGWILDISDHHVERTGCSCRMHPWLYTLLGASPRETLTRFVLTLLLSGAVVSSRNSCARINARRALILELRHRSFLGRTCDTRDFNICKRHFESADRLGCLIDGLPHMTRGYFQLERHCQGVLPI